MSKWRTLILCGILLAVVPSGAQAQGFKWWQDEPFKKELGLTADQCTRIDEVYQSFRQRMSSGKEALERLETRLSDVIAEGTAPEADVVRLVDQVEAARGELYKSLTLMSYRMRRVLAPEQRVKMKAMHDRWLQERRKNGPPPGRESDPERKQDQGGLL
jgi:Spy/CpxP family protein refolding chaperone